MARRSQTSPVALGNIADQVVANVQQALYHHPGGYTNEQVPVPVDASMRFLAIPPIVSPSQSNHLRLSGMPIAVQMYRQSGAFWASFDSQCTSLTAAYFAGGAVYTLPLNPGLKADTLAFCSTEGTGPMRVNWIQG